MSSKTPAHVVTAYPVHGSHAKSQFDRWFDNSFLNENIVMVSKMTPREIAEEAWNASQEQK